MKITKLAEKILLMMVKEYKNSEKETFTFDNFETCFSNEMQDHLIKSIYLLKSDGFVNVLDADDKPSFTTLLPSAIRQVEEDTLLKKGYSLVKQIKDLIP